MPPQSDFNNLDCQTALRAITGAKGILLRCKIETDLKSGIVQSDFQITDILSKWKAGFPKPAFDAAALKRDFPGLADPQLHYLDNAATAQMLKVVLDALRRFEVEARANVHEGMHRRARAAANAYQEARARVTRFLRAGSEREVVFTMEQPPRSIY